MTFVPNDLKRRLNAAIADVAAVRGGYIAGLRSYTRNRKLTACDIISLLVGFSGGSPDEPFSVTVTTSQRNIDKKNGWIYLKQAAARGKRCRKKRG